MTRGSQSIYQIERNTWHPTSRKSWKPWIANLERFWSFTTLSTLVSRGEGDQVPAAEVRLRAPCISWSTTAWPSRNTIQVDTTTGSPRRVRHGTQRLPRLHNQGWAARSMAHASAHLHVAKLHVPFRCRSVCRGQSAV